MDIVATKIFFTNIVTDSLGVEYPLHSHTSKEQGEFLQEIIRKAQVKVSLEVGLAYGISTLFICEILKDINAKTHIVMDPYQSNWKDIGLKNIKEAGYENLVDFRRKFAHEVLPELFQNNIKIDFAYLDASKVFDVVLVNIYYITKLLNVGVFMVLDDCDWPGIRKVCRFLAKHPSFKVFSTFQKDSENIKYKIASKIISYLPSAEKIFANNLVETDEKLGINAHCVCFQKIKEDERHWSWFQNF
mgnify:CR=1 FL=1